MSTATDCDLFEESKLCVAQLNNLIDRQTTEDEVVCQELCQSFTQCSHFTFVENKYPLETGEPNLQCYLWKRCIKKVAFIHFKYPGIDSEHFIHVLSESSLRTNQTIGTTKLASPGFVLFHGLHLLSLRAHPSQHA